MLDRGAYGPVLGRRYVRRPTGNASTPHLCAARTPRTLFDGMSDLHASPRRLYLAWIEDQIEEYKAGRQRDELIQLAEEAVQELFDAHDGQYPLTEILLRDAVDALIFRRLKLPSYRQWLRLCRIDTRGRPSESTPREDGTPG